MIHYGLTPKGELEINATGRDIGVLYRAICTAHLPERGTLYDLKTYIEEHCKAELQTTNDRKEADNGNG